jgi:hypothetical protein
MPLADHDSRKRYQYGVFATITRAIIDCEKLGLGFNTYPSIQRIQAKTRRFSISGKAGMTGHGYTQGENSISAFTTGRSAIYYHKRITKQSSGMAYFTAPVLQEKDEFCLRGELLACLNIAHLALL